MHYRMYGWGSDPAVTLPALKARGYASVTGGYDANVAAICREVGLSYYVSTHGFASPTYGYTCADGAVLPKEICPCDAAMRAERLASLRTLAASDGIAGITIDFCCYPSMVEGNRHFFGCFCETCMIAMTAAGFDAARIRASVLALSRAVTEGMPFAGAYDALSDWIRWKTRTITAHFNALRDAVKSVSPDVRFGAFTFAPSIARLVGQDYEAFDGIADYLSPMLYRHWTHPAGDACLDREAAGLMRMAETHPTVADALAACGFDAGRFPGSAYLARCGVNVSHMVAETETARTLVKRAALVPIYLLEDPHIAHTVDGVRQLCDGIDFFVYRDETIDNITLR